MTTPHDRLLRRLCRGCACALLLVPALASAPAAAEEPATGATADRPTVLLTNDDGIDEPRLHALARGFAEVADVLVVAPLGDRSGSSTHLTLLRRDDVRLEPREVGEGIRALGLDGYPADCVVFGILGPLGGEPPDLVVSGINGGTNPGPAWLGSGTVGAARMAAAVGVPAIAVSGLDDSLPGATEAAVAWVVELALGPLVRGLERGRYLTVSLPRVEPGEVTGVEIVGRDPLSNAGMPRYHPVGDGDDGAETWRATAPFGPLVAEPRHDVAALAAGRIAVVPMRVGEVDRDTLERWRAAGMTERLPPWPGRAGEAAGVAADPCAGLPTGSPFVVARSPAPGATVGPIFEVVGCSRTFESTVTWRLLSRDGRIVAEGVTQGGGVDGPGPFRFTVEAGAAGLHHLEVDEPPVTGEGFVQARTVLPLVVVGEPGS